MLVFEGNECRQRGGTWPYHDGSNKGGASNELRSVTAGWLCHDGAAKPRSYQGALLAWLIRVKESQYEEDIGSAVMNDAQRSWELGATGCISRANTLQPAESAGPPARSSTGQPASHQSPDKA